MTDLQIFKNAPPDASAEALESYLDGACGGDVRLRSRVEALFQAEAKAGGFMARPALDDLSKLPGSSPVLEGPGTVIGRYKLLQEIGAGGFGVVYMAEQKEPVKRRVALKIIKIGMDTQQVVARFEAERQALAMMDHPNIAKVLDAGATDTGRPYFVMELVKGVRITEYCDENQLTTKERLELFIPVCQAIQHAHQKGIIHRDIKPSNVMVTLHDGVPVPKVIDFGIAKATQAELTEKTIFTQYGQFIGTPAYMSPEQAEMSGLDIDTRSDIYSLGVLLYELLVGRTPLDSKELLSGGFDEIRRRIKEEQPTKPSTRLRTLAGAEKTTAARHRKIRPEQLSSELRGDLDWIVLKALEKDRTRRYETANGLGSDLQRHLDNEPVVARPPSTVYRLQKAFRRNRLVFAAAAAIGLVLMVSATFSVIKAIQATQARNVAVEAQGKLQKQYEETANAREAAETSGRNATQLAEERRRQIYALDMYRASQYLQIDHLAPVLELLAKHVPRNGEEDLRGFEWRYLWSKSRGDEILKIPWGAEEVQVSPGGRFLAGATYNSVSIRNLASPQSVLKELSVGARTLSFSPDDRWLAGASDSEVTIWDTTSWAKAHTFPDASYPAKFSHDGKWLAFIAKQELRLVSTVDWKIAKSFPSIAVTDWAYSKDLIEFSRDGAYLIYPIGAPGFAFLDLHTLEPVEKWAGLLQAGSIAISLSPDGRHVAVNAGEKWAEVHIWDLIERKKIAALPGHRTWITRLEYTPDGKHLVSVSADRTIKVWDVAPSYRLAKTMIGHSGELWTLAVTPDSQTAVTSGDGTVRLWDLATKAQPQERQARNHHLVGFSPDGTGLFTLHSEPPTGVVELHCWHQETGTSSLLGEIAASAQDLAVERGGNGASASAKGDKIAVGMKNGTVRVWDVGARRLQEDLLVEQDVPTQVVAFHPLKNDVLATGGRNGSVKIWNLRTRELLATLPGPGDKVMSLCLSPTENLIGIGKSSRFQVFSLDSGKELFSLEGGCVTSQFSPDGKHVAASSGWVVHLWEVKTGKVIAELKGQFASTDSVSFSPDGKTLATGNNDWTVKLWHVQSGTEMMTFHANGMARVLFSPNDQRSSLTIGGVIGSVDFHWNEPFQTLPVPSLMAIDAERLGAPR